MSLQRRDDWIYQTLCRLVDPLKPAEGAISTQPSRSLMRRLLAIARVHGVLGIVVEKLHDLKPKFPDVWEVSQRSLHAQVAQSIRVRRHGQKALASLSAANVPAVLLKGVDFADALYPNAHLKPTFDVDVLVPRDRWDDAIIALENCGHVEKMNQAPMAYAAGLLGERSWIYPGPPVIEVDLHWNLIDLPSYRKQASIEYRDLEWLEGPNSTCPAGRLSPASRLVIAAVHATYHHQFETLRLLVDLLQAARRLVDAAEITKVAEIADRTHTRVAIDMSLGVAARFLEDPALETVRHRIARSGTWKPVAIPEPLYDDARRNLFAIHSPLKSPSRLRVRQWLRDVS